MKRLLLIVEIVKIANIVMNTVGCEKSHTRKTRAKYLLIFIRSTKYVRKMVPFARARQRSRAGLGRIFHILATSNKTRAGGL